MENLLSAQSLLFIGDSITEWGRPAPTSPDYPTALGTGYVAHVDRRIRANHPGSKLAILNRGIGGNTIRDLAARWEHDVLDLKPDWLSVMIGINDVWRAFDPVPARAAQAVHADEFERTYEGLLETVRPRVRGLVVFAPFYVQGNLADPMRARMDEFGAITARVAHRHHARWIDSQAIVDALIREIPSTVLAADRVHIDDTGHRALAIAFLDALEVRRAQTVAPFSFG